MSRRHTAIVWAVVLLGACSGNPDEKANAAAATTSSTVPGLKSAERFTVGAGEPAADVKQRAVDVLQSVGTYTDGEGTIGAAAVRAATSEAIVTEASMLLGPGSSAIDVIYPQLGGLTDSDASVMVVMVHRRLIDGVATSVSRTVDVRVARRPSGPEVMGFASVGGEPVVDSDPGALAMEVLSNERIELPDSARWDVIAGRIDDRVLALLSDLGRSHSIRVTVLSTGHPANVFATEYLSNHTKGRGVDIWSIDGVPVVAASRDPVTSPLRALVVEMVAAGVTEVGSPFDVDGSGGPSFTNVVHQDHLHLAWDD